VAEDAQKEEELSILNQILTSLQRLDNGSRIRILQTVTTFFGIELGPAPVSSRIRSEGPSTAPDVATRPFSEDRSMSPKEFMFLKQPQTDVEKVAITTHI
jgi:hypothetical protein